MRRIALTISYDGTLYGGWQRQQNAPTIQETIENAIEKLFGEKVVVMGSGRTDAGVHAVGQIGVFDLEHTIPCDRLVLALNANLPDDIRILLAKETKADFNPQFDAKKKTYHYTFYDGTIMPPHLRLYAVPTEYQTNWDLVEETLHCFEGTMDFKACCASGSAALTSVKGTVRTIYEAKLIRNEKEKLYTISICGNGFLYNMVRIIAGTVLEVGKGALPIEAVKKALVDGDRAGLGQTAPAKGLTLYSVEYEEM